ncbi:uncharacterized protein LOC126892218 [Diabrotica virgifera virgifera]|uniref:Uncharacterized protein n=1 Tax=Diabrotica virgifera virgifera TaxID=50390 RepID=A0ABM5L5G6_DIAVI|nr:uncharacterized protein LOC126892218 [Diabrotica virgifera virgifera]
MDWLEYVTIAADYFSIPLRLISILCDILLIAVILKYRRLKNRTNCYLLNFAIFHIFYVLSIPLFYCIMDLFYPKGLEVRWYCICSRIENFAIALLLTFIAGYGVDVVVESQQANWFPKYEKRYFYLFFFFYFFHVMIFAISANFCFKSGFQNNFNSYFLTTYYLIAVIFLLYLGTNNKDGRLVKTKSYALNISIVILLLWLPLFMVYNLINIVKKRNVETVLWSLAFLPEFLAYSCSMVVFWKLWKDQKQFKTAFRKIFRREVSVEDYEELFVVENNGNSDQNKM